jgi:hypothetical protein
MIHQRTEAELRQKNWNANAKLGREKDKVPDKNQISFKI